MLTYDHTCPDCGGAMVLRRNKKTDEQFWGCTFYPSCTGTRTYDGGSTMEIVPDDMPSDRLRRNDRNRWRNE